MNWTYSYILSAISSERPFSLTISFRTSSQGVYIKTKKRLQFKLHTFLTKWLISNKECYLNDARYNLLYPVYQQRNRWFETDILGHRRLQIFHPALFCGSPSGKKGDFIENFTEKMWLLILSNLIYVQTEECHFTFITKSPSCSFRRISSTILTHSASGIKGSYRPATS